MKCVVLVPCLRRPHRVAPLVDSLNVATPSGECRLLFLASPGDDAEQEAVLATGADLLVIEHSQGPGDYARKINCGYRATTEPLLFLAADDVAFRPGWLAAAREHVDTGAHVVGTNDLGNPRVMRGEHATHSLVTRSYIDEHGTIDEPGAVLFEGYHHNWCDTEFVATAKRRGVWSFAPNSIVEHLHPHWNKAQNDAVYDLGQSRFNDDRKTYQRRCHLWT